MHGKVVQCARLLQGGFGAGKKRLVVLRHRRHNGGACAGNIHRQRAQGLRQLKRLSCIALTVYMGADQTGVDTIRAP